MIGDKFICPHCKKEIDWCECEEEHPDIECANCGSHNVVGTIRNEEWSPSLLLGRL